MAISAMGTCWGFIDTLHRIREIAQGTPGLNSKHPEMRVFLEATELAKTYRNYVQHLRGKLCGEPPNNSPVWGSLAWVDDTDPLVSYLVNFGARLPGMEYLSCVYDTAEKRWVSRVSLGLDQASFNFDPVFESARRFEDFVMPHLHEQIGEAAEYQEQLPIIKFRAAESTN